MKIRIIRYCLKCNKKMELLPCRVKNGYGIYCSRTCARIHKPTKYWLGKIMDKKMTSKMSKSHKGRVPWNTGIKGTFSGEKNPMWKGGISSINSRIRNSMEYKMWRKTVFSRDNYTCVWCGANKGGNLNADHIKPFALYPELRFAIDNGRTLCIPYHKTTDTFAGKMRKYESNI